MVGLEIHYWQHHETENDCVTPDLIPRYAASAYDGENGLFTESAVAVLRNLLDDRLLQAVYHLMLAHVTPDAIPGEVTEKPDRLAKHFADVVGPSPRD